MTHDEPPNLSLEDLESKSVHRLVELSHQELKDFIDQAAEIERSSKLLKNWLMGIRQLKTRRDEMIDAQKRGDL